MHLENFDERTATVSKNNKLNFGFTHVRKQLEPSREWWSEITMP